MNKLQLLRRVKAFRLWLDNSQDAIVTSQTEPRWTATKLEAYNCVFKPPASRSRQHKQTSHTRVGVPRPTLLTDHLTQLCAIFQRATAPLALALSQQRDKNITERARSGTKRELTRLATPDPPSRSLLTQLCAIFQRATAPLALALSGTGELRAPSASKSRFPSPLFSPSG